MTQQNQQGSISLASNKERPQYYLGLCAIARDENPFVREWVSYHHYIGFEKIYIYDNQSAMPVRDLVTEFYDAGVCDTYTLQGEAMQNIAYNLCLRDHGHEFEWLAFFDLDEFMCLKYDSDARVLLRDYEDYSGLILHWDVFSSSGHLARPQGMVTQNYTQSLGYSCTSKCIVRPRNVKMTFTAHHFIFNEGFAVNTNKEPALSSYTPIASDKACLNHYKYRSQQDFAEKLAKADATFGMNNPRSWESFYKQAQASYIERGDILPTATEVFELLESRTPAQRHSATLAMVQNLSFSKILSYMVKILQAQEYGLAEVIFALSYKKFYANWDFVSLGISLCFKLNKTERALTLIEDWMAHSPDAEGYLALLEYHFVTNNTAEARRIGEYLLEVARLTDNQGLHKNTIQLATKYSCALL